MQRGKAGNRKLDQYIGTPLLNAFATFRRRRNPPAPVPATAQRIGVMCSPALGDTLLFSAVLQDLRAAQPQAHITHICMQQNLAAAELIPGADALLVIALTSPVDTLRKLRAEHFDVLLDFTSWQRLTAFYTMLSGAKFTVGFATAGQHRARGYDRTSDHRSDRHELENYRALLAASGYGDPEAAQHAPAITLPPSPAAAALFPDTPDIIAFHLWASGQRSWLREWPEDRWIDLAHRLTQYLANPDTLFLITGAPSDEPRITPFVASLRAAGLRAEPFISPDGFRTLTHLLLRARLVVTVNTGVMHLAATAGATTLAINGPNRNGRWGPIGPRALGVEAPGTNCGFLHLGFNFDGNPTDCMARTSVDQVFAAATGLLATAGER